MDVIRSERLELLGLPKALLEALRDGRTAEAEDVLGTEIPEGFLAEVEHLVPWRLQQIEDDPASEPWLLRALIVPDPRTLVGYFNFHGPPSDEGWVEMGYDIQPEHRRRGYAQEAAIRMMKWAHEDHGVELFRASIGPGNEPSLQMIDKLGFTQIGTQMDEIDGLEIVFQRSGVPQL